MGVVKVSERRQRFQGLLTAEGEIDRGQRIAWICRLCVSELAVSGAGATVLSESHNGAVSSPRRGLVHASDPVSAGLEDLQLTVGEGPCLDAFAAGGPVLVSDLAADLGRWPAFGPAAAGLGAAAVFSFPLQVGVVRLGSMDLYRDRPGPLTPLQLTDALILADLATHAVIDQLDGHATTDLSWLADAHVEVHQATGMVSVQLGATTETALLRLRGYAFTHDVTVTHAARQVVARRLRFTPDGATA
ncbi:GAF and ANTAR domain-containing protein [Amycolatopsis sp. A133]|uniref:GAF and ANTAR domain-containing protein n=1 Tax=Amycolatopsis sp. A133 TaxID=3064472 RepID=UPI0027F4AFB8|nr:GAF and ANTAR domain-containing protein [Amycolatopsis sp. A133]MDQ7810732.1 GAF and ANTAR domain-containing protein [Amycolatopsis sp. A133]